MIDRNGGDHSATFKIKDHLIPQDDAEEAEGEEDTNKKMQSILLNGDSRIMSNLGIDKAK